MIDVVVVGAGAAGLYTALCAAREGGRVVLLSAGPLAQTASYWAQGGLAAVLAADDSFDLHLADTERAGRGAVRRSAAEALVREAPECVRDLERLGFHFDADRHGRLALGLEGGHSVRRIVHAGGSATGRRLLRELSALAVEHERIEVVEEARVRALWQHEGRCVGVVCWPTGRRADPRSAGRRLVAGAVVLSTGGTAALWSRTTNPPGSVGQGMLLAHAAGAELADLEMMQFHPTAVIGVRGREGFLVTEAIRGEGATLHDASGERFVDELAPRDEVSRAIQARLRATGERSVGLDMRSIDPALFPNVVNALREAGLDPTKELVPVAPAAHYTMGGIVTDVNARSRVPGLYAVGETACTGLHGANRLASNSLSECFVFGRRAALSALEEPQPELEEPPPALEKLAPAPAGAPADALGAPEALPTPSRQTRALLWEHAGVERSAEGLSALLEDPHPLARMIGRSALERRESRGAHTRIDHPQPDPRFERRHAVMAAPDYPPGAREQPGRRRGETLRWEAWE
jgi:L-aspartate oxidase